MPARGQTRRPMRTEPPSPQQVREDALRLIAQAALRQEDSTMEAWTRLSLVCKDWQAALSGCQCKGCCLRGTTFLRTTVRRPIFDDMLAAVLVMIECWRVLQRNRWTSTSSAGSL